MTIWGLTVDPTSAGAAGLLGLGVLMVFTGRLIPRSVHLDTVRERDQWREIALKSMGHTDALLPAARIAAEVTRSLGDQTSAAVERALSGRDGNG